MTIINIYKCVNSSNLHCSYTTTLPHYHTPTVYKCTSNECGISYMNSRLHHYITSLSLSVCTTLHCSSSPAHNGVTVDSPNE